MRINDWQSIQTLWDKLNKQLEKTQRVTGALGTPRPYIKITVELEDFLNATLAGEYEFVWVWWLEQKSSGMQQCFWGEFHGENSKKKK